MKSLWHDAEAARCGGELALRVYTSRLLGRDRTLVLHGGGNTSVKLIEKNLFGEDEEILYIKGSGADLEEINEAGFAPLRLDPVRRLARLPVLSDTEMLEALRASLTRPSAPTPSVEAILHAVLPYKYVDHTHADAVLAVMNSVDGEARIREIYGADVVLIPYVMPGFALARLVAERFPAEAGPRTAGLMLMHHGVFSFGASARESYERMIELVARAENYLARRRAWQLPVPDAAARSCPLRAEIARLRRELAEVAGFPVIVAVHDDARSLAFARRPDVGAISQHGPATPDHAIRTKRVPLIGRDVRGYAEAYRRYFDEHAARSPLPVTMLDPAPRVVLDAELGVCTVGRSAEDTAAIFDIYAHTMDIIERAERLGGYRALPAADIFAVEYWELEQAKLKKAGAPRMFAGEVALVTGAASGIGKACVESFLARGAAVIGLDVNPVIKSLHRRPDYLGLRCDVTDAGQIAAALERAARAFGGLDMLVLNAGVFPPGARIEALTDEEWQRVLDVNLDANLRLLREAYPLLRLAPRGGRVVAMGSKNVPAPGPGAAAYSAAKAALTQLVRIAALEWAGDGIRVNVLHPHAVFDTGIWTEEVLAARAAHYGLSAEQYKRRNLLKVEIGSRDVAELAAELCGPLFAKVTGAQIPIDGGDERVI